MGSVRLGMLFGSLCIHVILHDQLLTCLTSLRVRQCLGLLPYYLRSLADPHPQGTSTFLTATLHIPLTVGYRENKLLGCNPVLPANIQFRFAATEVDRSSSMAASLGTDQNGRVPSELLSLFSLKGKTAIVSGGTGGIGLAIVEILADAGANVAILYHRNKDAIESARIIEQRYRVKCKCMNMCVVQR